MHSRVLEKLIMPNTPALILDIKLLDSNRTDLERNILWPPSRVRRTF